MVNTAGKENWSFSIVLCNDHQHTTIISFEARAYVHCLKGDLKIKWTNGDVRHVMPWLHHGLLDNLDIVDAATSYHKVTVGISCIIPWYNHCRCIYW